MDIVLACELGHEPILRLFRQLVQSLPGDPDTRDLILYKVLEWDARDFLNPAFDLLLGVVVAHQCIHMFGTYD